LGIGDQNDFQYGTEATKQNRGRKQGLPEECRAREFAFIPLTNIPLTGLARRRIAKRDPKLGLSEE